MKISRTSLAAIAVTLVLGILALVAIVGQRYDLTFPWAMKDQGFNNREMNIEDFRANPPIAPELTATAKVGAVQLEWQPAHGLVRTYHIYRKTGWLGFYKVLTTTADSHFLDTNLKSGHKYSYYLTAIDELSTEGEPSTPIEVIPK